jgi:hypothetical protein
MRIKNSFLLFLPFFCLATPTPLFLPPAEWHAAQPKGLSSTKVGFVGKSATHFCPSMSLSSEKVDCSLKEYVQAVKQIHRSRPDTHWRDLGTIEMKAGIGRLVEIRTSNSSILQAIYLEKGTAYILTAAVAKEDFLAQQKEILASFKSFHLTSDLWSEIPEKETRSQIFALIEAKEWKSLQQLIEKETSSMGKYWQFLALQEAYGKIFSK